MSRPGLEDRVAKLVREEAEGLDAHGAYGVARVLIGAGMAILRALGAPKADAVEIAGELHEMAIEAKDWIRMETRQ